MSSRKRNDARSTPTGPSLKDSDAKRVDSGTAASVADEAAQPNEVAPQTNTIVEYSLHDVNSSNWMLVARMQQTDQNVLLGKIPIMMLTAIYSRSVHRCLIINGEAVVYIIISGHCLINGQFMYTLTNVSIDSRYLHGSKQKRSNDAPDEQPTPGVGMVAFRDYIRHFYEDDGTYSISALATPDDAELHGVLKYAGFIEDSRFMIKKRDAINFKYDAKSVKDDAYSARQNN